MRRLCVFVSRPEFSSPQQGATAIACVGAQRRPRTPRARPASNLLPSPLVGGGAGGEGAFRSSLTGSPLTGGTLSGGSTPLISIVRDPSRRDHFRRTRRDNLSRRAGDLFPLLCEKRIPTPAGTNFCPGGDLCPRRAAAAQFFRTRLTAVIWCIATPRGRARATWSTFSWSTT
jgi:hypothetical protein